MREVQEPILLDDAGISGDGQRFTHPAFGQIAVHRVQGLAVLYGSDFVHHGYVTISISRSDLMRDLSHDWPLPRAELIEVALSEAQWATFVSSLNIGTGVQCTIQRHEGKLVPGLPDPQDTTAQFMTEADERLGRAIAELERLRTLIDSEELKASGKTREVMRGAVNSALTNLRSNLPFVARSFGEHMQRRAEKAKVEIMAWMHRTIQRAGLQALTKGEAPLELPGKDPEP